ncbi:MAG: ABC transporter permease [Bacillota bacterium]|jgi:peptide/nickel transport system permease protein
MVKFLLRRVVSMFVTMLVVSVVIFLMAEVAPGNVARNILGAFATPEQEASFHAQLGLNQPLYSRYLASIIGNDWQAARKIGLPLRLVRSDAGFREWWAVETDGSLVRWRLEGQDLVRQTLLPDGNTREEPDNDRWQPDGNTGVESFWGVDGHNRAVHWIRGDDVTVWVRAKTAGFWVSQSGGGVEYIPLQKGILRGDPGVSIQTGRPIADALPRRFLNSLVLAAIAFVIVMPIGLVLGIIAGVNRSRWIDRVLSIGGLMTTVSPEFATGLLLILVFSSWLGLLPGATVFDRPDAIFADPKMLILPVLTLALIDLGYVLRITRASMIEVMGTGYVRTAILKGLPQKTVIMKHALRNALMAPITVIMYHVNWLIGGIVVVEAIFGFPGIGMYIYQASLYKDVFAMQAATMIMVALAVGTQLAADLIYTLLNPRIRYS